LLVDQDLGEVLEQVEDILVDVLKVLKDTSCGSLDNILWLWHSDSLELDSSLILDLLNELIGLLCVEGNASSGLSSSGSSSRSMNVGLGVLWWLNLDDEVDILDVETSGSDISGNEHLELTLLESLHGDLSLVLSNISMHNLDILLDLI
jgi:hypothetical protein